MTFVHLGQQHARPVQVLTADGSWVDGWLEAYQQTESAWSGFVRYSMAVERSGQAMTKTYLGWFEEGRIRGQLT